MAINNLEEYLIERLLDLDPTLSTRAGSLMFVKVINPLISRLGTDPIAIDVEAFITQRLRDEFPELDVASPGSSLRDLIVSPLVLLMEPIRREVEFLRTQQSLSNQDALSEAEMDAILANVFSQRSLGDFARGTARVFFSAPYPAPIEPTITFSTVDGKVFVPEASGSLSLSDFQRSGSQFFVDFDLRSTVPSKDHNIPVGALQGVTGLQNVVRVTNLRSFSGGVTQETNEEFLERAERSLSERSLNTKRGIETDVLNSFDDIVSVDVIGFGESEMQRDILQGDVDIDLTETTGPMSYMTSDWLTHDVLNGNGHKRFPFTNTIILKQPAGGWSEKTDQRIQNARFMRIADGSGDGYDHRLLGRVRTIAEAYKDPVSGDYYIKTDDFEVYPQPDSITGRAHYGLISIDKLNNRQGLNPEPTQGSDFKMFTDVDGEDIVTGSYLNFTDVLETTFSSTEVPGSVIKGRDFLVTADNGTIIRRFSDRFGYRVSKKIRTFPLKRFFTAGKLGVGRVDSFLISRDRYLYRGSDEFVFDTSLTYCAINENIKIIDFGAPKFTSETSAEQYGGILVESGGRSSGVTLEGKRGSETGPGSVPNVLDGDLINDPAAPTYEADIILERSALPWDERGAQEGHFISCTLFDTDTFDGAVDNTPGKIVWNGIGVVTGVGRDDRWRLRVKGMDWTQLESGGHNGFAPSASAIITVGEIGDPDIFSAAGVFNPEGQAVFNSHPGVQSQCHLNYSFAIDDIGDGILNKSLMASVLDRWGGAGGIPLEPASTIDTRSTIAVTVDEDVYAQPAEDFRLAVVNGSNQILFKTGVIEAANVPTFIDFAVQLEAAVEASRIADNNPSSGGGVLIERNDSLRPNEQSDFNAGRVVFRSMPYGNFALNNGWRLKFIQAAVLNDFDIPSVTFGEFTSVEDRSPEALAAQLVRQANNQGDLPFIARLLDETNKFSFTSTQPNVYGNGQSIIPQNSSFTASEWNGEGTRNINGGFSAGFGPKRQVKGLESALPAFGTFSSSGYEQLLVSPDIGTSNTYIASTAYRNIAYQRHSAARDDVSNLRVIFELEDDGNELNIVLDDDALGNLVINDALTVDSVNYPKEAFSGTLVYGSGLITLNIGDSAADLPPSTKVFTGYNYFEDRYKLAWTLYRGTVEVIDANGFPSKSVDELAYPPALTALHKTYHAGPSAFDGESFYSDTNTIYNFDDATSQILYGLPSSAKAAYWIRLGKPFHTPHPSIGGSPSTLVDGAEFTFTTGPDRGLESWQPQYFQERLFGETSVPIKVSAPIVEAERVVETASDGDLVVSGDLVPINNAKGLSGFLIPLPMGTGIYDLAEYGPGNELTTGDLLEHQVVQLFEAAPSDFGETRINISGIPGGVPLPGFTSTDLDVVNDQIHIGGLTDVYLKPTASTTETTEIITLSPASVNAVGGDVVLEASDGIVRSSADDTHFLSAELESALTNLFGPTPAYAENLVLEILEPPSLELLPRFVRIIHSVAGGCKIDGSYPDDLGDGFENLRFRVLRSCTTSLVEPLNVLQQGQDLSITDNDFVVSFAGGINFTTDPENVGMFLQIDSETGRGEYGVVSRNLSTLQLDRVPTETGSGLSYRIYIKQGGGISLPLVRVREVSMSGDSAGVKVPYAKPIDVVASSFSGLNDDPITEDIIGADGGLLARESVTIDGEVVERCTFSVPGLDFRQYGVIRYDVVVLSELTDTLRHWYVEDFIEDPVTGEYNKLVLDRAESISSDVVDTPFIIGKPSIGQASVKFLDPTFFSVGPDSVFCYEDMATGKKHFLRPSPAETACIFKSYNNTTDVTMSRTNEFMLTSTGDFFKHGVAVGDTVRILTKVLMSGEFEGSDAVQEHENISASGKTLAVKVNNTLRTVTFSGPNPITLETVVNDINQQLGDDLRAEVVSENRDDNGDGEDETYYRIMISSSNDVEIVTRGTIGIIEELRMSSDLDNTPQGDVLIGDYKITAVNYIDAGSAADGLPRTTVLLDTAITAASGLPAGENRGVFIEVLRSGHQQAFPAELTQDETGLYTAEIKLTSYETNTSSGIVPEDAQLTVDGYKSLGYHLEVENSNYSYSVGEKVSIVTTPVALHSAARSFETVYEVAAADVTITYDNAPTIDSVQDYMLSPTVRVLCNNPLVRHYFPAYPIMSITYAGNMSVQTVTDNVESLISTLYPNRPLEVYALSSMLSKLGVTYIENPQQVGFVVHDADRNIKITRSQNRVALSKQTHLMEDMSGVTVNKVG